jgi:hypothetical protein
MAAQLRALCDDTSINTEELLISFRAALTLLESSSNSSLLKSIDLAALRSVSARPSLPRAISPLSDGRPPRALSPPTNASAARLAHLPTQVFNPHAPQSTQQQSGVYDAPTLKTHRSMYTAQTLPEANSSVLVNGGSSHISQQNASHRSESPGDRMSHFTIVDASELALARKRHAAQRREHDMAGRTVRGPAKVPSPRASNATSPTSWSPTAPMSAFTLTVPHTMTSKESVSLFSAEQLESFANVVLGASTATTQAPSSFQVTGRRARDSASSSIRSAEDEDESPPNLPSSDSNNKSIIGTVSPILIPVSKLCTFPLLQGHTSSSQNGLSSTALCTCEPPSSSDGQPRRCSGCRATLVVKEAGGKQAFMELMKSLYSEQSLHSASGHLSKSS